MADTFHAQHETAVRHHACSRCGGPRENARSAYCRKCRNAYAREYRAAGREALATARRIENDRPVIAARIRAALLNTERTTDG